MSHLQASPNVQECDVSAQSSFACSAALVFPALSLTAHACHCSGGSLRHTAAVRLSALLQRIHSCATRSLHGSHLVSVAATIPQTVTSRHMWSR